MIAPNTFVNCDIPSHSVVIGNLCKVFSKDNATKQYVQKIKCSFKNIFNLDIFTKSLFKNYIHLKTPGRQGVFKMNAVLR